MNAITTVIPTAHIGYTGYLDEMPWSEGAVKGSDENGRPFFALPLLTIRHDRHGNKGSPIHTGQGISMVCFFKRYSDPTHPVWVACNSHKTRGNANPIVGGRIENPLNGDIEQLMLRLVSGEAVEFIWGSKDEPDNWGLYSKVCRLMSPAEVQAAQDRNTHPVEA